MREVCRKAAHVPSAVFRCSSTRIRRACLVARGLAHPSDRRAINEPPATARFLRHLENRIKNIFFPGKRTKRYLPSLFTFVCPLTCIVDPPRISLIHQHPEQPSKSLDHATHGARARNLCTIKYADGPVGPSPTMHSIAQIAKSTALALALVRCTSSLRTAILTDRPHRQSRLPYRGHYNIRRAPATGAMAADGTDRHGCTLSHYRFTLEPTHRVSSRPMVAGLACFQLQRMHVLVLSLRFCEHEEERKGGRLASGEDTRRYR